MPSHEAVAKIDKENLEQDWPHEVETDDFNVKFKEEFVQMMSHFELIWNGHLGCVNISKHQIEFVSVDVSPILSAPYQIGLEARRF